MTVAGIDVGSTLSALNVSLSSLSLSISALGSSSASWTAITIQSGYEAASDSFQTYTPEYTILNGFVHLRGGIMRTSTDFSNSGSPFVAYLPVEARPAYTYHGIVATNDDQNQFMRIQIMKASYTHVSSAGSIKVLSVHSETSQYSDLGNKFYLNGIIYANA